MIRKEIEAFVGDRLLEAIWREALWLIKDGICTIEELDDIMRYGFGLRWAQMGMFETYRIAGGEAGMRHFMAQFGPCLKWPWTKLMDVPEFNDELVDLIAEQSDAAVGPSCRSASWNASATTIWSPSCRRLKANNWGAGEALAAYERRLFDARWSDGKRTGTVEADRHPGTAGTRGLDRLQQPHERGALPAMLRATRRTPSCA